MKKTHITFNLKLLSLGVMVVASSTNSISHASAATAKKENSTKILYGVRKHLPVQSEGGRFISDPYGESRSIVSISNYIQTSGTKKTILARGISIPNKLPNQIISQYSHTFPKHCGAYTFSSYQGQDYKALGLHYKGIIILDAMTTSGPFASPRIWGLYDQILNEKTSMNILFENPNTGTIGLTSSSYMVGMVPTFPEEKKHDLGTIYKHAVSSAVKCVHQRTKASNSR